MLADWDYLGGYLSHNQKIVLCHGCWDILHIGHIRQFEAAKRLGTFLVVTVTPDKYVNKGENRPIFQEQFRAEAVAALRCVDLVAINLWPDAVETIHFVKPDIYVKGLEYKDRLTAALEREKKAVESLGGKLVFVGHEITHSTDIAREICK